MSELFLLCLTQFYRYSSLEYCQICGNKVMMSVYPPQGHPCSSREEVGHHTSMSRHISCRTSYGTSYVLNQFFSSLSQHNSIDSHKKYIGKIREISTLTIALGIFLYLQCSTVVISCTMRIPTISSSYISIHNMFYLLFTQIQMIA